MTSSTPTIKAVPDGTTGANISDPVAELRRDEAQHLISMASRATRSLLKKTAGPGMFAGVAFDDLG